MKRVYVIQAEQLPPDIGYLEIVSMDEEQVKGLPHELLTPEEFENEWNANIRGLYSSTEQFVRFF